MTDVTISIVSHGQALLVSHLLGDLASLKTGFPVLLTLNLPEVLADCGLDASLRVINNPAPKGFGANHNAAFDECKTPFFCVVNPDIRLSEDVFPALLRAFDDPSIGVVAPLVVNAEGNEEDSARYFPTLYSLGGKALGCANGRYPLSGSQPQTVDWLAGMFMLFRASAFSAVTGFDEGYFLYYEDVDICVRLRKAGWRAAIVPAVRVQHDAQRTSRRDPRYLYWHIGSLLRYLRKHWCRLPSRDASMRAP